MNMQEAPANFNLTYLLTLKRHILTQQIGNGQHV